MINIFKHYPKEFIAGIFIGGFSTIPFTTIITFINPVLMTRGFFSPHQVMLLQAGLIFISAIVLLISGRLGDSKSPAQVMKIGALLLAVLTYPLLLAVDSGQLYLILFGQLAIIIINEILLGPSNAFLKNIFPMQYRYRASSFSFCLGMSVLGGLTPLIESKLYSTTEHFASIAIWPIAIGVFTFLSIHSIRKNGLVLNPNPAN